MHLLRFLLTVLILAIFESKLQVITLHDPRPPAPPDPTDETINSDIPTLPTLLSFPDGPPSIAQNDASLDAPIVEPNGLLNSEILKERPTSPPVEGGQEFPKPSMGLSKMVEKAKEFARKYLNATEIHQLKGIASAKKRSGATPKQLRKVVLKFLNSVLEDGEKLEISSRKAQLEKDFGDDAITAE